MSSNDALAAYQMYLAIKMHFTSDSYDYFKYGGKSRAGIQSFEKRKDRYFFKKLARQKDLPGFLVANALETGDLPWIGNLVNDDVGNNAYKTWQKRQESLTYVFKQDLDKLDSDFNSNVNCLDGQHPPLLKLYLQKEICIETICIMNLLVSGSIFKYWDERIDEKVVWPQTKKLCVKYGPFIRFNEPILRRTIVDKFKK